ncbi:MAG: stimulus-sensing domain-containing protein, partial [Pseudomonadota bacterium]
MVAHVEATDRIEADDSTASADPAGRERTRSLLHLLTPARLTSRIVLLNIAGLIILVSGTLFFNQFRQGLIDAQVDSLLIQGQVMAAAVASTASGDTGSIVIDPDRFIEAQPGSGITPDSANLNTLDFDIEPEPAGRVLRSLVSTVNIRGRIYDRDGLLVVDSTSFYSRGDITQTELPPLTQRRNKVLRNLWRKFYGWVFHNNYPLQKEYGLDDGRDFTEVSSALNGSADSIVRINQKNEIIVSVAVPIQRFKAVLGSLVLSTKAGEIDKVVKAER